MCLVSTPSIYFAIPDAARAHCTLFEFDEQWSSDPGFVFYDFNAPEVFDEKLRGTFSIQPAFAPDSASQRRYS